MSANFKYQPLIYPVVSNNYEIAKYIVDSMFAKGLISKCERDKIDEANRRTFLAELAIT